MPKIIVFSSQEKEIIDQIKQELKNKDKSSELSTLIINEMALVELSKSISLYPSILKHQQLGNFSRSFDSLIDYLCMEDVHDLIFRIPTKAILGQGFSVAKINFLSMLRYICGENKIMPDVDIALSGIIADNVYTIMVEEILLAIISDKEIPLHIRTNAGFFLVNIWEYRIDYGIRDFTPILNNLWRTRVNMVPSYGTMLGITELFRISRQSDPVVLEFLQSGDIGPDEVFSLWEFLMGLSFEEIKEIKEALEKDKKISFSEKEINERFPQREYAKLNPKDPRSQFKSFHHRKNKGNHRKENGLEGPKKTIEEYIMSYLLSKPEQWAKI